MDETTTRDHWLKVRVNSAEKVAVDAAAAHLGIPTSEYLRQAWTEKMERDLRLHVGLDEADDAEWEELAPLEPGKEPFTIGG